MVHVGDSVKKGDILVSGRVEILNDSGEVTGYHYLKSDADIRGQTSIVYEERQNLTYTAKKYENIKKEYRSGDHISGYFFLRCHGSSGSCQQRASGRF